MCGYRKPIVFKLVDLIFASGALDSIIYRSTPSSATFFTARLVDQSPSFDKDPQYRLFNQRLIFCLHSNQRMNNSNKTVVVHGSLIMGKNRERITTKKAVPHFPDRPQNCGS